MSRASWLSKPTASSLLDPAQPIRNLSIGFWLWKAILFVIIISCPGLGYDSSSSLLPYQGNGSVDVASFGDSKDAPLPIPLKFVRWDSIYFEHIARDGYIFEQEWAFSSTYSSLVNSLSSLLFRPVDSNLTSTARFAVSAVALAHVAHYLSVLALYRLSINVFGHATKRRRLLCFLSAALHIISPAGAFLSAPYGEPLFSFLNITGFYIYSSSQIDLSASRPSRSHAKLLLAGCFFAAAAFIRSNGILSGILLAYDALKQSYNIISRRPFIATTIRLGFVGVSGCIVALGLVFPQYIAYTAYCAGETSPRPWCQSLVPSIYGWVQDHYWGVGFLRYWTVPNIPLFLLAAPMLVILFLSSVWAIRADVLQSPKGGSPAPPILKQLAIVQFVLTAMALTGYHVQIINRISSGYPLWYWFLAWHALETSDGARSRAKYRTHILLIIQVMVIYALVQAVLFGSFLPPA
ncbi:GPI mannosyltransferase 2 [Aspergillus crustosus]